MCPAVRQSLTVVLNCVSFLWRNDRGVLRGKILDSYCAG